MTFREICKSSWGELNNKKILMAISFMRWIWVIMSLYFLNRFLTTFSLEKGFDVNLTGYTEWWALALSFLMSIGMIYTSHLMSKVIYETKENLFLVHFTIYFYKLLWLLLVILLAIVVFSLKADASLMNLWLLLLLVATVYNSNRYAGVVYHYIHSNEYDTHRRIQLAFRKSRQNYENDGGLQSHYFKYNLVFAIPEVLNVMTIGMFSHILKPYKLIVYKAMIMNQPPIENLNPTFFEYIKALKQRKR